MTMIVGKWRPSAGFTLIELIVTLAVAVILATIAVPSFQGMMLRSQWASDYNNVITGVNFTRSEAIKRRSPVSLEFTSGGKSWSYAVSDKDSVVLRVGRSSNENVAISVSNNYKIKFNPLGRVEGGDCDGGCEIQVASGAYCRLIDVSGFGRVSRADCAGDGE